MRAGAARAASVRSDLTLPAPQRRPGRKRPRLKFESLPPGNVASASGPRRRRASGRRAEGWPDAVFRHDDEWLDAGSRSDGREPGLGKGERLVGRSAGCRLQVQPVFARFGERRKNVDLRGLAGDGEERRRGRRGRPFGPDQGMRCRRHVSKLVCGVNAKLSVNYRLSIASGAIDDCIVNIRICGIEGAGPSISTLPSRRSP